MTDNLLPCPFCGGSAELQWFEAPNVPIFFWVACTQCHLDTPVQSILTEQDARTFWNTRADNERLEE